MPFVTKSGGFRLDDGVVRTHKDVLGNVVKGNQVQTKVLANIGATGLDPESEEFKLAVMRGTPRPDGTSWASKPVPVFIIQHYNFDDSVWKRFLAKFEKSLIPGETAPSFSYEPAAYDIVDLELGVRAMPLWVIDWLDEKGIFDSALKETKVESTAMKITPKQHELIRKSIDNRRILESESETDLKQKEQEIAAAREKDEAAARAEAEREAKYEAEIAEKERIAQEEAEHKVAEEARVKAAEEERQRQAEEAEAQRIEAEQQNAAKTEAELKAEEDAEFERLLAEEEAKKEEGLANEEADSALAQ